MAVCVQTCVQNYIQNVNVCVLSVHTNLISSIFIYVIYLLRFLAEPRFYFPQISTVVDKICVKFIIYKYLSISS
jgi:hypothetical protein